MSAAVAPQAAPDVATYAAAINKALMKTVSDLINIGKTLSEAHATLSAPDYRALLDQLHCGRRTAEMLRKISEHPVLGDAKRASQLPPHWYTLNILSGMSPPQLEAAIDSGAVAPTMNRGGAKQLLQSVKVAEGVRVRPSRTASVPAEPVVESSVEIDREAARLDVQHLDALVDAAELVTRVAHQEPGDVRAAAVGHALILLLGVIDRALPHSCPGKVGLTDEERGRVADGLRTERRTEEFVNDAIHDPDVIAVLARWEPGDAAQRDAWLRTLTAHDLLRARCVARGLLQDTSQTGDARG